MHFKIEKKLKNSLGRAGTLTTAHGSIQTPAFVAVGTKATVKSLSPEQVRDIGTEVVLANTYHLYLQPGDEVVRQAGGLGKFMNWRRSDGGIAPTMTDSGGFQVFSLGAAYGKDISKLIHLDKITDPALLIPERFDDTSAPRLAKIGQDGVSFKSHLDGSVHYITPEKSIQIQHNLGADIIFAFDECTSPTEDLQYQEEALERTHRWAERSLAEHVRLYNSSLEEYPDFSRGEVDEFRNASTPARKRATPQEGNKFSSALFGIVQGGREEGLRKKSAKIISEMRVPSPEGLSLGLGPKLRSGAEGGVGFDGFGIGGSFAKEDMATAVKWVNEILPEDKPRHLLGIGEPEDLFMGVENGVDLFDCVLPTRLGRNGTIYTGSGKIIIMNTKFRNDFSPIEKNCGCYTCKNYSRAYVAHLFHGKEMLAGTLASIHNLYFIVNLVKKIRQAILDDNFFQFKKEFFRKYSH